MRSHAAARHGIRPLGPASSRGIDTKALSIQSYNTKSEANPELKEWHTVTYPGRMPGLKFGRTLWACAVSGGPFEYTGQPLRDAHFELHIAPEVFDEVSAELGRSLDHFNVPEREKGEVLAAFNSFKPDVTAGSMSAGQ